MPVDKHEPITEFELTTDPDDDEGRRIDCFETVLENSETVRGVMADRTAKIDGIVIGHLVAIEEGDSGGVLVDYPENIADTPQKAISTVDATSEDLGRDVALSFIGGNPLRPVVLGFVLRPGGSKEGIEADNASSPKFSLDTVNVERDGESLTLTAERDIVLRCGKASITLTRAGKVLIRGAYVLTRSSGVNRIKGGSVQIN